MRKTAVFLPLAYCLLAAVPGRAADADVVTSFERAEHYFAEKDYVDAIVVYRGVLERDPKGPYAEAAAFRIGMCDFGLGEYDAATLAFVKFEEGFPKSAYLDDAAFLSAQAHFRMGEYHRAFERLLRVLAFGKKGRYYDRAVRGIGNIADDALAADHLNKRLEDYYRSPEAAEVLLKLGQHEIKRGDYQKALVILNAVARDYADRAEGRQAAELLASVRDKLPRAANVVGVLLPLSGDDQVYGDAMRKAIDMAAAEYNAARPQDQVKVVYADTTGTAEVAKAAAENLIYTERAIALIGPAATAEVEAVAPVLAANQIPALSPAATEGKLTALNDYVFLNGLTRELETDAIASYAVASLHLRRFACLYPANGYGQEMKDAFAEAVKGAGGEVAGAVEYPLIDMTKEPDKREVNYSPFTKQVKWLRADAVYLPGHYTEIVRLLPQLTFSNVSSYILGSNGWNENRVIRVGGKYVEGTYFTAAFFADAPDPAVRNFVAAYRRETNEFPNYLAAQAYDAAHIVFDVLYPPAKSGDEVRARLAAVRGFAGITGATTLRDGDGGLAKKVAVLTVQEGEVVAAP